MTSDNEVNAKITDGILKEKYNILLRILSGYGHVAIAFSGGVDSTLLLQAARDALGDRAVAVTVVSHSFPEREYQETVDFCRERGIRQLVCRVNELEIEGFAQNPPERCYLCKRNFFQKIQELAREQGIGVVAEGSNLDDMGDYRPGMRAIAELGIVSPLREAGLDKAQIRALARDLGLSAWDKPAYACLATRIPYGEEITAEKLSMVEQAEELLGSAGFRQRRVRIHGRSARIELLTEDFARITENDLRERIVARFEELGFDYVALDLKGYRTGSMNTGLNRDLIQIKEGI
ncbi:MAG: ATP-dependent sacrificial sulfur transferase LarE [Butyrivibrio sp.]|nr:ATP-dependent sacrificial sulfur transferase LarE [Butyrivibrio sp.]